MAVVAGSTVTGVSNSELDSSDIGTGNNLRIVEHYNQEGRNEVGSDNIVYKVLITEHKYNIIAGGLYYGYMSRQQLAKELKPGLNALFGLEYKNYENQHSEIFDTENSDRAFEEEVMLSGFDKAAVKSEGSAVTYDSAQETFTARYQHETICSRFLTN